MSEFIPAGQGGTAIDTESAMRARVTELEAICVNLQQQAALHFEERQRLQARLAAVLVWLRDESEARCYCEFNRDGERTLHCEHCEAYARAVQIAEGE